MTASATIRPSMVSAVGCMTSLGRSYSREITLVADANSTALIGVAVVAAGRGGRGKIQTIGDTEKTTILKLFKSVPLMRRQQSCPVFSGILAAFPTAEFRSPKKSPPLAR